MGKKVHKGNGHRERLRQKFFAGGLAGFLDYEVIELLLILNTPRRDCKETAKELLKKFKTLQAVLEADPGELQQVKGVGKTNVFGLQFIKEVADRYLEKKIIAKDVVKNPDDLIKYIHYSIGNKNREYFAGIFLDAKNKVLASEILFQGSLTSSSVYPREVIIKALQHQSAAMIFAHNHPSGDISPSPEDIAITRRLVFALNYVGIIVHEHLITGGGEFYSFHENGYIEKFKQEFDYNNKKSQ